MEKDIRRNNELDENNPDEILEDDRPRGGEFESQIEKESAGDNLETQNPTQEQTSGEDDVGGVSDEEGSSEYLDEEGLV